MKTNIQVLVAGVIVFVAFIAACGGDDDTPQSNNEAPEAMTAHREPPERPDREPLIESETTADGLKAILGTGDLGVGRERIGFVLTSKTGFINTDGVQVKPKYISDGAEGAGAAVDTEFHEWPYGNRGLYTTYVDFDRAGDWVLDISVPGENGATMSVPLAIEVFDISHAPMQGHSAVSSKTRTVDDVETIEELTTGSLQDPDLYQISLDQALENEMPTVVVFASPAFCQNAVCGPQVDVLQELKNAYPSDANFVHVDFYDNPHEIQGDLERAVIAPAVLEWRLPSIEWTFVIDKQGIVTARFEGFATYNEVEAALRQVL
ncbi:MAG: hypothetical protein OXD46_02715 [Chloroflexi bacterium]|nr:hypothetical protein [Chloroflexota bacterium]